MFYFKLHPLQWVFEDDSITIFRALELKDGNYMVSWEGKDGKTVEVKFSSEEVTEAIVKHHWLIEE